MYGERFFQRPKKQFWWEIIASLPLFLSRMGVGNSDTREAQGCVRTTVKYSVKSSDKLFFMRMGYGEINIA